MHSVFFLFVFFFKQFFQTISIHRTPSATVIDNKVNDWIFHFDGVHYNVNQEEIFEGIGKDVVDRTLDGYNGSFVLHFNRSNDVFPHRNNHVLRTDRRW